MTLFYGTPLTAPPTATLDHAAVLRSAYAHARTVLWQTCPPGMWRDIAERALEEALGCALMGVRLTTGGNTDV